MNCRRWGLGRFQWVICCRDRDETGGFGCRGTEKDKMVFRQLAWFSSSLFLIPGS